jgi:hypothetical protein
MMSIASGCQSFRESPAQPDRWGGPLSELRVQWTGASDLDLTTGLAVPVRAYIESRWLAQRQGNLDYGYPGFLDATPPNADGPPFGANFRRPEADNQVQNPFIGNETFRITAVQQEDRNVTATLCRYSYTMATMNDDGSYSSVASLQSGEPRGIDVNRVLLVAPTNEGQPLPAQEGPEAAPSGDVFGGWSIEGYQDAFFKQEPEFASEWPTYDADLDACVSAAPDSPERRAFLSEGDHPREDFPTSAPSPGWPGPSQ